jgi:hypothetical protein
LFFVWVALSPDELFAFVEPVMEEFMQNLLPDPEFLAQLVRSASKKCKHFV